MNSTAVPQRRLNHLQTTEVVTSKPTSAIYKSSIKNVKCVSRNILVDAFPGVVQALLFVFFFDMPHVWSVFAVQPFLVAFGILARNLSLRCFGVSFRCLTQSLTLVLVFTRSV